MGAYDIIYADPAWPYTGSADKMAAAGKHYPLMSWEDLAAMPVREHMARRAALFMWATGPLLHRQVQLIEQWGLHYRGVAWVWAKTRKDGQLIGGQGVPPTFVKPTTEFVLAATTNRTGRAFPILDQAMHQVVLSDQPELQGEMILAPRELPHSRKPAVFRDLIVELCGDRPRLELFARERVAGWDQTGFDLDGRDYRDGQLAPG
jgi:N6-adenosine-specific RNA methylase IME4